MKATARRAGDTLKHHLEIDGHTLTADEPKSLGGSGEGPSPQQLLAASLASCSAVTMEMYARRKGWDVGELEVEVDYEPAQRGSPTRFRIDARFGGQVTDEQREKLMQIMAKCPVHRTLEGEVMFEERHS